MEQAIAQHSCLHYLDSHSGGLENRSVMMMVMVLMLHGAGLMTEQLTAPSTLCTESTELGCRFQRRDGPMTQVFDEFYSLGTPVQVAMALSVHCISKRVMCHAKPMWRNGL